MPATVHFATNRVLNGPPDQVGSYSSSVVAPSNPNEVTYGTAFVNDANLTADTIGAITSIQTIGKGQFSQSAIDDLSDPGRNLLVFIHGFDNSFENAITRAAFNQQWFAQSGLSAADTSVVAFSWPSAGKLIALPFPSAAYRRDQTVAGQSGLHIMTWFANLEPIIASARAKGNRVFLLTHSMGNWALQAAGRELVRPRQRRCLPVRRGIPGRPPTRSTAASNSCLPAPERTRPPQPAHLDLCQRQGRRARHQHEDQLRQAPGPGRAHDRSNLERFPPAKYRTVMCGGFTDYHIDLGSSHQYYRRSPGVRMDIANTMAGNV
jgi:hypothetical protein